MEICYCPNLLTSYFVNETPVPSPPAVPPTTFPVPTGADVQIHNDTAYTIVLILFSNKCKDVYIGRTKVCSWVVTLPGTIMGASFSKKKLFHKEDSKDPRSIELFRIDTFRSIKEKITQTPVGYVLSKFFPPELPQQQNKGTNTQPAPTSSTILPWTVPYLHQTQAFWAPCCPSQRSITTR